MELEHITTRLYRYMRDAVLITEADPLNEPGPRIVWCNEAFTKMTGHTLEEIKGRSPRFLQGQGTSKQALRRIREALQTSGAIREELLNYTKSGKAHWVELDICPVTDQDSNRQFFVSVQREITDRKMRELELLDLRARIQTAMDQQRAAQHCAAALDAASVGVWHMDCGGSEIRCNDNFLRFHGLPEGAATIPFSDWLRHVAPDDIAHLQCIHGQVLANQAGACMRYRVHAPGVPERWLQASFVFDDNPVSKGVICTQTDITKLVAGSPPLDFACSIDSSMTMATPRLGYWAKLGQRVQEIWSSRRTRPAPGR
ncbi:PAS domain-containing protein [Maricaulis sp. CAU 1757]